MQAAFRLLAMLFVLPAAGSALGVDGSQYMVEMELWIDGEQRGTPIVVTPAEEPATVEIGDPGGGDRWKIELVLEPPAASEGAPGGAIWLNLSVYERRDGEWELLADSLLGVPEGRSATMTVIDAGDGPATRENSLVHLTAQASLLRPGAADT